MACGCAKRARMRDQVKKVNPTGKINNGMASVHKVEVHTMLASWRAFPDFESVSRRHRSHALGLCSTEWPHTGDQSVQTQKAREYMMMIIISTVLPGVSGLSPLALVYYSPSSGHPNHKRIFNCHTYLRYRFC
jgi:hypothetical protein